MRSGLIGAVSGAVWRIACSRRIEVVYCLHPLPAPRPGPEFHLHSSSRWPNRRTKEDPISEDGLLPDYVEWESSPVVIDRKRMRQVRVRR